MGPGRGGIVVADRWQPRAKASQAGLGRRNPSPPWMSHSGETEESCTMCVTRTWDCAILGLKKGGVEITPTSARLGGGQGQIDSSPVLVACLSPTIYNNTAPLLSPVLTVKDHERGSGSS